ncbi:MAG: homocysteine S-methyltransferase family protein [Anaerolineae bacterium]|nr:homocysteine S-methyltransferase family protein [Anaerolineae bacterium]
MNLNDFLTRETPILLDGAMGTQLELAGLEMGGQNNLTHPEAVLAIHNAYAACGVDILITNTLTMNRIYIETHNLGIDVRAVNQVGVQLAKAAAAEGVYVLGDLSATGKLLEPYGDLAEATAYTAFQEQANILAEAGVDGFIIETVFDLQEALCALRACKRVAADLPALVTLAFQTPKRGGRTLMGNSAKDCARVLTEAGASAVGANCGDLTPSETAAVITEMRAVTSLPILVQPNAGKPRLVEGKTVFDMTPEAFATGITDCLAAGAHLVGGCCGTSPAHIHAIADLL